MSKLVANLDSEEEVINAFRVFDKEETGWIPTQELRHIVTNVRNDEHTRARTADGYCAGIRSWARN